MATIDVNLELQNLQEWRRNLKEALASTSEMSEKYEGLSSSTKELEKALNLVNRAISIYTTKVRADGTMDIKTARELQEIYKELSQTSLELSDAESKRNSPSTFKQRYKFLTDENSELQKSLNLIEQKTEELEKQEKILQKTSKLSSFIDDEINTTGIKSNARIKKVLKTTTDEDLRKIVKPAGKKGNYTTAQKNTFEEMGITEEDARKILKLYEEMGKIAENTSSTIKDIKDDITAAERVVAEENKKIQDLLGKGVTSGYDGLGVLEGVEKVSPKLKNLIEEAERARKSVINLKDGVKESDTAFKGLAKTLFNTRVVLSVLRKIYDEAVRTVQEMDKALTGMTAVTGQSREQVTALIPELKELAQETSSTMTEVANLTTEFLRQGRTLADSMNLARETAKAAKIAEISVTDSLTYMTSAINGFNLAATDAAHVNDVFAQVAVGTATDYEQLAIALSKVSAQANLAGMSMEYTTALLAKGIETTQEAPESIGTALKTIIARMRELTDYNKVLEDGTSINKVEAALKSAGIELRTSTGSFRDLEDVFNELGPKWEYLNSMQQQAIAQAVAGTRQQSRFVAIMQDWNRTLEITNLAQESAGASAYQYSKMAEGLEATLTNLTTAWQGFATSLVDTERVINVLQGVTNILNTLAGWEGLFKTALVTIGAIVAIKKVTNFLDEWQYQRAVKKAQIDKEGQEIGIYNNKTLQQSILKNKALLEILKAETAEKERQLEIAKEEQKTAKDNVGKATTEKAKKKAQKDYNKKTKEVKSKQADYDAANEALENQSKTVDELVQKNDLLIVALWKRIQMEFAILFTKQEQLTEDQAKYMLEKGSILSKIKLLTLDESRLAAIAGENKLLLAQLKIQKQQLRQSIKIVGVSLAVVAAVAAIALIVKEIDEMTLKEEEAIKNIEERSARIAELNSKQTGLDKLIEEYEKLSSIVNKTAEEEERLLDLEKQMQQEHGITGTGINALQSAREKRAGYNAQRTAEYNAMISDTLRAFEKSANKIDFFKNSTFENAFKDKYRLQLETNLEEEFSEALAKGILTMEEYNQRMRYARQVGNQLINELDSTSIAQSSIAQTQFKNRDGGDDTLSFLGRVGGFTAGGAVSGALIGGAWGAAIGAGVGLIAGLGVAIFHSIADTAQERADQYAETQTKIMATYTKQLSQFATDMAMEMDEDLSEQYKTIKEALNNGKYAEETKNAIEELYEAVIAVFENATVMAHANNIKKKLGDEASDFINNITTALYGLGTDAVEEAFRIVSEALDKGATETEAAKALYLAVANQDGIIYSEEKRKWEDNKNEQIAAIEKNLEDKEYLEALAKQGNTTTEAIRTGLQEELGKLTASTYEFSQEYADLKNKIFSLISHSSSTLELNQELTALNNSNEKMLELNKSLNEGTLTFEQLMALATEFTGKEKEFYAALSQGMDSVKTLIIGQLTGPYEEYLKTLDKFVTGQEAIIESMGADSAAGKAAAQNIKLVEEYRKQYMLFNETSFETYYNQQKLDRLEREKNDGSIKALEEIVSLKAKEREEAEKNLELYFTQYPKELELIKKIRSGAISFEEAWEQVGKSDSFKRLVENTEEYFDAIDEADEAVLQSEEDLQKRRLEIQDEALKIYTEKLESEKEALQKSLDERKKAYEKYFDALDNESSDEDFADKQRRLQQAIASLASSTDSNSLALKKEYEEELRELEKDQLKTERDRRRDATMTMLDNTSESIDQYYEERLKNEQKLWEELSALTESELEDLYKTYNEEYKKSTDLNKQYLLDSFKSIISGVQSMTGVSVPGYSSGGLVTHTGLAAVHGSSSKPEAFLNASQTALFSQLASSLESYYNLPSINGNSYGANAINVENITIAIDAQLNDNNIQQTGESLADALLQGLRRTGISVNTKK